MHVPAGQVKTQVVKFDRDQKVEEQKAEIRSKRSKVDSCISLRLPTQDVLASKMSRNEVRATQK